jgi:hypothetical protein
MSRQSDLFFMVAYVAVYSIGCEASHQRLYFSHQSLRSEPRHGFVEQVGDLEIAYSFNGRYPHDHAEGNLPVKIRITNVGERPVVINWSRSEVLFRGQRGEQSCQLVTPKKVVREMTPERDARYYLYSYSADEAWPEYQSHLQIRSIKHQGPERSEIAPGSSMFAMVALWHDLVDLSGQEPERVDGATSYYRFARQSSPLFIETKLALELVPGREQEHWQSFWLGRLSQHEYEPQDEWDNFYGNGDESRVILVFYMLDSREPVQVEGCR